MSSNAKTAPGNALTKYFSSMSEVSVPTFEEETATFRKLMTVESDMVAAFLKDKASESSLRAAAGKEDEVHLPARLFNKSGLHRDVVRFVRLTDSGRTWFQECLTAAVGSKDRRVGGLNARRERIKNEFVTANLRLTVTIVKKYARLCHHQTLGDLIQEGNIGLMRAVDRFDVDRGFRFGTYAVWWIRHHVKRAVSDKEGPIRIPVHMSELAQKLSRLDGGHMAENGTGMDPDQMAKAAKISVEKVLTALLSRQRVLHLDAPAGEEEGFCLLDTLTSETFPSPLDSLFSAEANDELLSLLSGLNPFESRVIRHRFGIDDTGQLTLQEVADRYDLSRERIRQIEEKALKKLRGRMVGRTLSEYLPEAV